MKEYNQIFVYKEAQFNINVKLNHKIEKRINGDRFHLVTINHMGTANWITTKETLTNDLQETIYLVKDQAMAWIDERTPLPSLEEKILLKMGFK